MGAEKRTSPADGLKPERITLKVLGQDGKEVFFRVKRNAKLKQLMNAYCERVSADVRTFRFLFDGRRVRGEQTSNQAGLEDGDEIDAMVHMMGAGSKS